MSDSAIPTIALLAAASSTARAISISSVSQYARDAVSDSAKNMQDVISIT
jgi:hypothetical protein